VTVKGAVQRPGVYTRANNLRVRDLLLLAGGPTPDAFLPRATLLHQRPDGTFQYENLRLDAVLKGDPAWDKPVEDNDVLAVYRVGEAEYTPERVVRIAGEVVAPGSYARGEQMCLSDLVRLAGGFRPGASGGRITVAHARRASGNAAAPTPNADPGFRTVAFDQAGRCAPGDDLPLTDGDVVTVPGTGGWKERVELVTIKGAVNRPGPVVLRDGMRLSDAVREAGGLRPEAFPEGAAFVRESHLLASGNQESLVRLITRLNDLLNQTDYQRQQARSDLERLKAAGGAARPDDAPLASLLPGNAAAASSTGSAAAAAVLAAPLARRDLVSAPRVLSDDDLNPNGSIAVDLAAALKRPGGDGDLPLANGDTITVPERPSTVQVIGAVFNGRAVLFTPGANLDQYVAQAGGFTPDAARDRIVVIHAGGGLLPARNVRSLRPGDVIVVPTRVLAEKLATRRGSAISDLFKGVTNTAIVLKLAGSLFGL